MRCILIIMIAVLATLYVSAQNGAAINTTGAAAAPSAMLDVSSDNTGILIPRMTEVQKNSILNPAIGLMIYQTDGTTGFWYFNGVIWTQAIGPTGVTGATGLQGNPGVQGITGATGPLVSGTTGQTLRHDGVSWTANSNLYNTGTNIGIGTTNPDASAAIEISSTSKGALIPRMTTTERNAILNPAQGLQIYNITTRCFEYFEYGIWQQLHCAVCPAPGAAGAISGTSAVCQGQNGVAYSVGTIANSSGYSWSYTGAGVTINGTSNAVTIDFSGTATSGDLTVFGTNTCGSGIISNNFPITVNNIPASPISGTHTPTSTQITWNWNSVIGATGYKYNTLNNFSSATDNGAVASYTQTGLANNTMYTLYVWAYNSCGNSSVVTLTQSTNPFVCGTDNVTFTYRGSSVTYGTVSGQNSTCWLNRNLGASQVAQSYNDMNSYGDLFQWGRLDDNHQNRSSTTTTTLSSSNTPGHSLFIGTNSGNWLTYTNNSLWQGPSGVNNPCPSGWRVPTETELDTERSSWWPSNNRSGAYSSPLKLPAGGGRDAYGTFLDVANTGYYWSSTVGSGTNAKFLWFNDPNAAVATAGRPEGKSVRCIKD